jgi:hypothetical protein
MNFETTFNIRQNFVIGLFLIFATLFVYGPVRNYEFVNFDDPKYIYKNPHIQAGLTSESIIWSFTTTYAANWHPLTWLSHMVDVELFGMNPSGHHISNIIFHLANTRGADWLPVCLPSIPCTWNQSPGCLSVKMY